MNDLNLRVQRRHWLVRFYFAQFRFYLHVQAALRIIPPPVAQSLIARLQPVKIRRKL